MDALQNMRNALQYIEENLGGEISIEKVAQIALCSPYHFQRMFVFLSGIPLSEYIRRRRLTLAARDLQRTDEKVIDIALKYGYSSPDAFARAFSQMHDIPPTQARINGIVLKAQPQIAFTLSIKGVIQMDYRVEEKEAFQVVGIKKRLSHLENLGQKVGAMWASTPKETIENIAKLSNTESFGLVGVYSEMYEDNTTDYYIGTITDVDCPQRFERLVVPATSWAVFSITGALPEAMATVWGRIFSEWFPATGYEHAALPEVEWYSAGEMQKEDYKSEIWIPIVTKGK